ncbi:MAG: CDP-alcohol phosphatidyltransferase family protein [Candidatus Lokiarchaeota archaeon]
MSEEEFLNEKRKHQKQFLLKFIDKPVNFLVRHHVAPNTLSLFGFLCSLGLAFFIAMDGLHFSFWFAWIVPFLLFWAGAFDVFDGEVARRTHQKSKAGAFLDSNLDRLSDSFIIIGLILGNYVDYYVGYLLLFLTIMISYVRAKAENENIEMRGVGFMERAERLIILLFAFIIEFWVYYLSNLYLGYKITLFFPIFIILYICLLILTMVQRISFSVKNLRKIDANATR